MNNLSQYMKLRGLRQEDLAEMVGVATSTINRAINEDKTAKLVTYKKCAAALEITLAQVFSDDRSAFEAEIVQRLREIHPDNHGRAIELLEMAASLPPSRETETIQADNQ